jgi:PAS domain S-box-containing protein
VHFRDLPIERKLLVVILVTTFSVLALTAVVLLTYEIHSYRQTTTRAITTMAELVGANSTAAVIYDDRKLAQEILSGLRADPDIVAAAIFDQNGKRYVTYPSHVPADRLPAAPERDGLTFGRSYLRLFHPVKEGRVRVGTVYLEVDLQHMYHRLTVYGWVLLGVLGGSSVLALLLSNVFQRRISLPLLQLAETAKAISERKDFSVRATQTTDDELGALTKAFNAMLERIETTHSALELSEAQLRLVTDHASVYLSHCDRQHRFKFVNRPYAARFGLEPAALVGKHVRDVLGEAAYESIRPHMEATFAGERVDFEIELPYENIGARWMHVVYVPERNASGAVVGLVAVVTEITARKLAELGLERARDEALAASRAKDDFLAALSHELRTPLNPVLLLATEAAADPTLPESVRADFDTISRNVMLEARLIDDLLDLTRITRGKLSLDLRNTDVHTILEDAVADVRVELNLKQIALSLDLRASERVVRGDPVRLRQIFWNVLKNAVKFTPVGGKIMVGTATADADRRLVVWISDTGIGLTEQELGRVFQSFVQGDHAANGGSHKFGGLGLGLAISRMLVELHAGNIRAESAGRDRGATFVVELPLLRAGEQKEAFALGRGGASGAGGAKPSPSATRGRVLLVEDHEPTRKALAHLLSRRRYEVVSAGSLAEARLRVDEYAFDLLVSDIGLPDGSGNDLMAELRQRFGLKGIALTGYGMEQDVARTQQAGFIAHLTKPVRVESLDAVLAELGTGAA